MAAPVRTFADLEVADLFAHLGVGVAHRDWLPLDMSRDFADPATCPLCRAGWCVQRIVIRRGSTADIRHGLALH